MDTSTRFKRTKIISITGIGLNLFLSVIKIVFGMAAKSQSMIADGLNNAGDIFTSVMTAVGNTIAGRPSDKEHPYGHGKAEYIFSLIISFTMILVAYQMFTNAVTALRSSAKMEFSVWLIAASATSIGIKLALHLYACALDKRSPNIMLFALAEDSRNDVFISLAVIAGSVAGYYGVYLVDGIVGIAIALWIFYSGLRVFAGAYNVLMDADISASAKTEIEKVILTVEGVDHIDSIMAKPVGINYILIVKISVSGEMHVIDAHAITAVIKQSVINKRRIADVIVHVNPVEEVPQ